jgi:RNA polymerase primary sigma factor
LHQDIRDIRETITNCLSSFRKEDKINIEWLKRVIFVNTNKSISETILLDYLLENGYENLNHSKKNIQKDSKIETLKDIKLSQENHTDDVLEDDFDFDPNEFLEVNKDKIHSAIIPTQSFEDNTWMIENFQKTNSVDLYTEIVNKNMGLVEKIANRYVNQRHKLEYEDLVSIGKLGLIKAIERFNPDMGYQFSTYATYWIRQKVTRAIMDEGYTIRIPVHMQEQINKLLRVENESVVIHKKIDVDWVCGQLDIIKEKYYELKKIDQNFLGISSLHTAISLEEEDSLLIDFVDYDPLTIIGAEIEEFLDPSQIMIQKDLRETLDKVLDTFSDRDKQIIRLRFGLDTGTTKTLEEVGQIIGVTRERIRQIEAKTLPKIQKRLLLNNITYKDLLIERE